MDLKKFSDLSVRNRVVVESSESSIKVKPIQFEQFNQTFNLIQAKIISFQLIEKNKNEVYEILISLIENFSQLILNSVKNKLDENCEKILSARIEELKLYVCGILKQHNTTWKRNKLLKKSTNYVEPVEKAIALKWNRIF